MTDAVELDHEGLLVRVALDELGLDALQVEAAPPVRDLGLGQDPEQGRGVGGCRRPERDVAAAQLHGVERSG